MAMIRARAAAGSQAPFRLVYSVRGPGDRAVRRRAGAAAAQAGDGLEVDLRVHPRPPRRAGRPAGRLDAATLAAPGWPPDAAPAVFVCGPTGFVETVADCWSRRAMTPGAIRTERFGPSGG